MLRFAVLDVVIMSCVIVSLCCRGVLLRLMFSSLVQPLLAHDFSKAGQGSDTASISSK